MSYWQVYPALAVSAVPVFRGSSMQACADHMGERVPELADAEPIPIEDGIHRLGPYFIVTRDYARQKGWPR